MTLKVDLLTGRALKRREARQAELEWFAQSAYSQHGQRLGVEVLQACVCVCVCACVCLCVCVCVCV